MQASPAGSGRDGISDALTDLLKTGAQQLIATAIEAEFTSYLGLCCMDRRVAVFPAFSLTRAMVDALQIQ